MEHIIEVKNLKKYYKSKDGFFLKNNHIIKAVDDVSFYIDPQETVGVVGESGCGKTTTGKSILRLIEPTDGEVYFQNKSIINLSKESMRLLRSEMQIIFQDASSALNPRWNIKKSLAEPIKNFDKNISDTLIDEKIDYLLDLVGLSTDTKNKLPHEFSGGQKQRIGIAKAMSVNPKFVVCDESVSALDVSIQAQILNLLLKLKEDFKLSYMFISHDLSVVKYISDRVLVMYSGKIVEVATTKEFFSNYLHPYSKLLINSVPFPNPNKKNSVVKTTTNKVFNMGNEFCNFYSRCPNATEKCKNTEPKLLEVSPNHFVACHLYEQN